MVGLDFDWTIFASEDGGHRFERFCTDLLRAQGYSVEHMSKGGNDEGKDILIHQRAKTINGPSPEVVCLVECKSRTTKHRRAISLEDINRSLWALLENKCSCLVVFSTYKFNSQAVNCFLRVNERGRMNISWIDQDDLIEMGRRHPEVWHSHLGVYPPPSPAQYDTRVDMRAYVDNRPIFWGDSQPLQIVVHNSGRIGGRAKLRKDGIVVDEVDLHHHAKRVLRLAADRVGHHPYDGLTVTFEPPDCDTPQSECAVEYDQNLESRRRIDHIFADPGGLLPRVLALMSGGQSVHLRGGAGCGKSRVLIESQRRLSQSLYVDLSRSDKPDGLLETMVQHVTGWPVQFLAQLPTKLVEDLSRSVACNYQHLTVVADFCGERRGHMHSAVAHSLVTLVSSTSKHLIIDNLQDATELDEAIVVEALSPSSGIPCLLTTRTDGAGLPQKVERIIRRHTQPVEVVLEAETQARLKAFVEAASRDSATQALLLALIDEPSFQVFMSRLKALRQLGTLSVLDDGRLQLHEHSSRSDFGSYAQLQELILYSRLPSEQRQSCTAAIEAAAIFGETFPASFIEHLLGQKGIDALDELERRELIVVVQDPSPYGVSFRFDHGLTSTLSDWRRGLAFGCLGGVKLRQGGI
ncbi:MAG: restriction endonuclease [Thermoanaerobaculia bacterium]